MAKSRGRKFAEITTPTNGVFDIASVPTITNAKLQNSAMTLAGSSVSLGGTGVANTDALSEGSSNLYFTDARVQTFLGGGTLAGNIVVPDNRSIYLGSSSDVRIYHDTTNTQLINATGQLQITSNGGFAVTGAATFSSTIASGAITSSGQVQANVFRCHVGTDSGSQLNLFANSSGHCFIAGHTLSFNVGANNSRATKVFINADGEVGIGGTGNTVDELLHLEKSAGTTLVKTEVAANSIVGFEIAKTNATTQSWRIVDGQTVNGDLEIYDVTDSRLVTSFNGAGNVKFTGSLGVNKAINTAVGLSVGADSTATNSYGLEVCNASANTRFLVDGVGNSYFYRSDNARGLTFEATSGNVGIGTARGGISPNATLHVAGENNGYDGTVRVGERGYFAHRDGGSTKTWVANNYNSDSATFGIRMKGIADSNEVLTVKGNGYVGIGTSSPDAKFEVEWTGNNVSTDNIARITAPIYPSLQFYSTNTNSSNRNWKIAGVHNAYGTLEFLRSSSANGTPSVTTLAMNALGNIGIGTHAPIALDGNANPGLTVSSNGPFILLQDANNSDKVRYMSNNTGELQFGIVGDNGASGKTEHMRITAGGKVGIGETNPIAPLSIEATSTNTANHLLHVYRPDGLTHQSEPYSSILLQNQETTSGVEYDGMTIMSSKQAHYRFQVGNTGSWGGSGAKRWQLRVGQGNAVDQMSIYGWTAGGSNGGNEVVAWNAAATQTNYVVSGNYVLRLKSSNGADLGIGPLNTSYYHFVIQNSTSNTFYFGQRCEASGGFHTYSDERLKKEITPISDALTKVKKMNGVTFKWIDPENRGSADAGKQFGVTAQNMLEVDSELPTLNKDPLYNVKEDVSENDEYYTMDYSRITPFLIEAIKEQQAQIEALQAEVKALKGE